MPAGRNPLFPETTNNNSNHEEKNMKTRMTIPSKHPFGRRGFVALLLALACAATTGTGLAASAPSAEDLCVVAVSTLSIPVVLKASDPNGLPLTFSVVSPPLHGTLSGTAPNLTYTSSGNFAGID